MPIIVFIVWVGGFFFFWFFLKKIYPFLNELLFGREVEPKEDESAREYFKLAKFVYLSYSFLLAAVDIIFVFVPFKYYYKENYSSNYDYAYWGNMKYILYSFVVPALVLNMTVLYKEYFHRLSLKLAGLPHKTAFISWIFILLSVDLAIFLAQLFSLSFAGWVLSFIFFEH